MSLAESNEKDKDEPQMLASAGMSALKQHSCCSGLSVNTCDKTCDILKPPMSLD